MLCSISGTVPEEPVVSKKSGLLFEKRLIEKVIQETGRCPITDEALEKDDLVAVSTGKTIKPRPTPATSIPGLLSFLQNEWDATVLETHQLRQALHAARQELSHALYQHDAATRVIARLLRERDSYRSRLETAQAAAPIAAAAAPEVNGGKRPAESAPSPVSDAAEPSGKKPRPALGSSVTEAMTACSTELSKGRKKRIISPTVATPDEISAFTLSGSFPLHNTRKGGILALAVAPDTDSVVATAGVDGTVAVYDRTAAQTVATLKGHSKKVLDVAFVGARTLVASGSADKTVRVWKAEADQDQADGGGGGGYGYQCAAVLEDIGAEVVGVAVHPTNDYLYAAGADGTWSFYDIARAECLARVSQDQDAAEAEVEGYASSALHPDGLIYCTGGRGGGGALIRVWESRTQKCVAKFDGHLGPVSSLSFSENGYYLASAAKDGVKLWDLRKLKNFKALGGGGDGGEKAAPATSVAFDRSGLFLGVGGADARVYGVKQDWSVVKEFSEVPKKGVFSLSWGDDAKALFVGGADHNLRVFS